MDKQAQHRFYVAFGEALKQERLSQGITLYALAKIAGQQINTLTRMEEGKAAMIHQMIWIQAALGVNIDDLVKRSLDLSRKTALKEYKEKKLEVKKADAVEDIGADDFI